MLRLGLICVLLTLGAALTQRPVIRTEQGILPSNQRYAPPSSLGQHRGVQYNSPSAFNSDGHNLTFVISAKDLPNTDALDNIDPYIKVYHTNKTNPEPEKFGTTEVLKDTTSGEFITVFTFPWKKGAGQKWIFKVKDSDNFRDTTIAEGTVDVDDYVSKFEQVNITLKTTEGKPASGSLFIQKTTPISFRLSATNLPRKDPPFNNGKSDPYVKCYWRRGPNGDEVKFFETQVINDVENAVWNETISFTNYIKGTDLWWVFKVQDSDTTGSDDLGTALLEIDPFVEKRLAKEVRLGSAGSAKLIVTPIVQ